MRKHGKITQNEREEILILVSKGKTSIRGIGRRLDRSHSSISEELRRNGMTKDTYSIAEAQVDRNVKASLKGRHSKLKTIKPLLEYVKEAIIEKKWSPEQIAGRLKLEKQKYQISHESIYRYIYGLEDPEEKRVYVEAMRRKRKKRRSRKGIKTHRGGPVANATSIHERPIEVENRQEAGHWEGDSVVGIHHQSAIGTIVERKTRLTIIVFYGDDKCSENVARSFGDAFLSIPEIFRKTMTFDRGAEMAQHQLVTQLSGVDVYFADKACPGQRGTNENTNGLIRQFFPKKTDFSKVSVQELKRVQDLLNNRPRKGLGFWTPNELLARFLRGEPDPPKGMRPSQ